MMPANLQTLIGQLRALAGQAVAPPDGHPYWRLRFGLRQETALTWEAELKATPGDLQIWRRLSVLHYWQAKQCEAEGRWPDAIVQWQLAIGYWAVVLFSDDFWLTWAAERAGPCGLPSPDWEVVRRFVLAPSDRYDAIEPLLVKGFIDAVGSVRQQAEEQFEGHFRVLGGSDPVGSAYRNLRLQWGLERAGAQLLDQLKMADRVIRSTQLPPLLSQWIARRLAEPRPDVREILRAAYLFLGRSCFVPHPIPSCGPAMVRFLGLGSTVEKFGADLMQDADCGPLADAARQIAQKLAVYHDPVRGQLLAMVDLGCYRECREQLVDLIRTRSSGGAVRELQELLCLACEREAARAADDGDFDAAVTSLEQAEQWAFPAIRLASLLGCDLAAAKKTVCTEMQNAVGEGRLKPQEALQLVLRLNSVITEVPLCKQLEAALGRAQGQQVVN